MYAVFRGTQKKREGKEMAKKKITRFLAGILCGVMIFTSSGAEQFVYAVQEQSAVEEEGSLTENPDGENEDPQGEETEQTPEEGENPGEEENGDGESSQEGENQEEESEPEESDSQEDENEPEAEEGLSDNSSEKPEEEQDSDQDGEERVSLDEKGNIASGIVDEDYGHIEWVIDSKGALTVTGTGDFAPVGISPRDTYIPWNKFRTSITSAKVAVNGMTDTSYMFYGCSKVTEIDLKDLNTSLVTDMSAMFSGCSSLIDLDIANFNTSEVKKMGSMFRYCECLKELDLSKFDTSKVENMWYMFSGCSGLTSLDLSMFDTSNVSYMDHMFLGCSSLAKLNLGDFATSNVTDMGNMFSGCKNLKQLDVSKFDTSNVRYMNKMFYECESLGSLNVSNFDTGKVLDMSAMFFHCETVTNLDVSNFNTKNTTDMSAMFCHCESLTKLDVSNFDTSKVTDMCEMFDFCNNLISLDISGFNTSKVKNMGEMFSWCGKLTSIDVSGFDTSKVTSTTSMFNGCSNLEKLDVSGFNTGMVKNMNDMFNDCRKIKSLDVSNFSTSNVMSMAGMFSDCKSLKNLDVSNFDTNNVMSMSGMFKNCCDLEELKVNGFDTKNVSAMSYMFMGCKSLLNLDLSKFDMNQITNTLAKDMLKDCDNLQQLRNPCNVKVCVVLPGDSTDIWYQSDGTVVKELPQNLPYSVTLGKNFIPEEFGEEGKVAYKQYILGVYDENLKTPIENVLVSVNGKCYKTDKNGNIEFSEVKPQISNVVFSKDGYEKQEQDLEFTKMQKVDIYMKPQPNAGLRVRVPDLNMSAPMKCSVDVGGQKIPWLDMDFSLSSNKWKGDREGVSPSLPVKISYDENTKLTKILVGFAEKDAQGDVNKESYENMKNLCKWVGNKKNVQAVEKFMKQHGMIQDAKMSGISVSSTMMGYIDYDQISNEIVDSGMIVAMSGSGTISYRPQYTGGVFYVKATLTMSAQGTLLVEWSEEGTSMVGQLDLGQALGIAGGVGTSSAHIEVGAEGALGEKIMIPFINAKESLTITANATVYAEVKLFIISAKKKHKYPAIILWPRAEENQKSVMEEVFNNFDTFELVPRDYAIHPFNGNLRGISGLDADDVYPDGTPEMVRLADGSLLAVWVTDFGTKSAENRTTLVYSVRKENHWSRPEAVSETGRADFSPVLTVEGNKAYLVWTNLDHVLETDFTVEEMLAATDVYFAVYENGSFGEPVQLSESGNGRLETCVDIATDGDMQIVAWLENTENNVFMSSGSNSIYVRTCENGIWGEKKCIAGELNPITSMAVSIESGGLYVAYTMDLDGDSETAGDVEVFLYRNGNTERITSDSRNDKEVVLLGNRLYWSADNEIMWMTVNGTGYVKATGIESGLAYKVMENAGKHAILTENAEGYDSVLCLSTENGSNFSKAIPVTDCGKKISDYAAAYLGNGEVAALTFEREILENPTETDVYGNTNLRVYEKLEAANLVVDGIYIEEEKVAPGATIPVELSIYNGASRDLTGVEVTITCGDSVVADHVAVSCQIGAGESGTVTTECQIGDFSEITMLRAQVIPKDYEDTDLSDNTAEVEIGSCDLALQDTEITLQDNGTAVLVGKLANNGFVPAQNVRLRLLAGGYEGEEIFSDTYGSLAAGAENMVTCTIPASCLDFESAFDGKYIYFSCDTDTQESKYDNNSGNLVVFPRAVAGIELTEETLSLPVKSRGNLHAHVTPADAFEQKICYVSDNTMVAVADDNGVVTAVGAGTATITAITADGGFAKSCEVTVTEAEAGEIVYGLDQNSLSLEKGKTGQLVVTDAEGNAPVDMLKWVSSDETIATVDENGLVTAVAAGNADVSVSVGEKFFDSCVVEVTDKEIQALLLDESSITLTEGETKPLQISIVPKDTVSDKTLLYVSGDEAVATVDANGVVTAVAEGTAQITVTSVNGKEASCQIYVEALPRFTVIFDSGLGDEPQMVENILSGNTIALPQTPTRSGYRFAGWYTQKGGAGELFTETTVVTESLTVYAYWIKGETTEDFLVEQIPDQVYTGSQIKPVPVVMDGGLLLQQGTDYTVAYKNNVKAGIAQVTIKGKGNYTKSIVTEFRIVPKSLTADDISLTAEDLKMGKIGSLLKPKVTVKDGKKKLSVGKEYEISFAEQYYTQELAGQEFTVTVTGLGNYTDTAETSFHIYRQAVSGFVIDPIENQIYTGSVVEPQVKVYASKQEQKAGVALTEGSDYSVSYLANDKAGTAKVVITGEGVYGGTKSFSFKIVSKKLDDADIDPQEQSILVKLEQDSLIYTGGALKPAVEVTYGERALTEGKDYTVSYQNNVNVPAPGAADTKQPCVTVKGKGSYAGSVKKYFTIMPKTMTEEEGITVTVQDVRTTKENVAVKPKITVKDGKKSLKEGKDYQVDYGEWTLAMENAGSRPEIMITGKEGGNYAFAESGDGVITKRFHIYSGAESIAQCSLSLSLEQEGQASENEEIAATYTGTAIRPAVIVRDGEETLTEGKDYTVAYKNNTNVPKDGVKESGKPQVVIKGRGRFTGNVVRTFSIEPLDLSQMQELTVSVKDVKYTGKALKPAVTVVSGKRTLKSGKDYVITYENNVHKAEKDAEAAPQVTIRGKGNYTGEVKETFRIYAKDISKTVVDKIPNQVYTGSSIEPEVTVRANKKDETGLAAESYTVSYQKNVKVGRGEVVIAGKGEYGGTKTVKFVILPKWLAWLK